jgi:antitoxin (DNA-binding transcriptional repressor) of toxin-antitoxin stability system
MTKTIDIHGYNLEQLLALVKTGTEVLLVDGETPLAHLIPVEQSVAKTRIFDMHPGAMEMHADFNDPLPDEFWR